MHAGNIRQLSGDKLSLPMMEITTRVASLDHQRMNQTIRRAAENSFKDWKSKFPLPISIKLEKIQDEVLLVIDTLIWFKQLKSGEFSFSVMLLHNL